jgi:sensor histidine kinase regulating citrate/malate metabolism
MEELNQSQITEERHCRNPRCNKILDPKRKRYCSELCRTRHSASLQYSKLKDNEEFKKKRTEKNKKYYEANKEELKAKMRVYGMAYFFRKRDEKKKLEEQKAETQPEIQPEIQDKKEETQNEDGGDYNNQEEYNNQ